MESAIEGASICKREKVNAILAVGGGSVMDCSKLIAAAALSDCEPWDLVLHSEKITSTLPIVVVPTMAATGSDLDNAGVITNPATNEKLGVIADPLLPKAAILNPENTFGVPAFQTAAGGTDILSHLIENYFDKGLMFISKSICESLMRAVIKYLPIALAKPDDYEARSQLLWASSLALSGVTGAGGGIPWSCHDIEHEISAFYDLTHGAGLAILTPAWMRYVLNENTVDDFCSYATNVWGIPAITDKYALAESGIKATADFLRRAGMPTTLGEVGIDDSKFSIMAKNAVRVSPLNEAYVPLSEEDVINIFKSCA